MHFRIRVTAADGKPAAVIIQVDTHPRDVRPYALNDIAKRWRIPRKDIEDVLATWTAEQLRGHLSSFTSEELKPPAHGR